MKTRCDNPNQSMWPRYGGRGIRYCERWAQFDSFYKDMGEAPPGMSLERLNYNENYSPENCKWATRKEQNRNKSSNRIIEFAGKQKTLIEWSEQLGLDQASLRERLEKWPLDRALTEPPKRKAA